MCLDRYGRCSDQCVHIEEGFRDTPKVRCHKISLNVRFESDTSNAYAFFCTEIYVVCGFRLTLDIL